jgi:hypothetical protein
MITQSVKTVLNEKSREERKTSEFAFGFVFYKRKNEIKEYRITKGFNNSIPLTRIVKGKKYHVVGHTHPNEGKPTPKDLLYVVWKKFFKGYLAIDIVITLEGVIYEIVIKGDKIFGKIKKYEDGIGIKMEWEQMLWFFDEIERNYRIDNKLSFRESRKRYYEIYYNYFKENGVSFRIINENESKSLNVISDINVNNNKNIGK